MAAMCSWWHHGRQNPNPISGLTRSDVKTIQSTWSVVFKSADAYGLELFTRFFRADPDTKKLFKSVQNLDESRYHESAQFRMHVYSFMTSLNMTISKLNEPEMVLPMMERLGNSHKRTGVPQRHFITLQQVFVDFLKNDLKLKSEQMESWGRFIGFIYPIIFNTLNKA